MQKEKSIDSASILYINTDFGLTLSSRFQERFEKLGGEVVGAEGYNIDPSDLKAEILKVTTKKPQALFLAGHLEDSALAVQQLQGLNLQGIQILGSSAMHLNEIFDIVPKGSLDGMVLANIADDPAPEFLQRFEKKYKTEWPGGATCAPQAFDGLQILVKGLLQGISPEKLKDYVSQIRDYKGVSGAINFDAKGDLISKHSIFEVKNSAFVKVQS